ncbi:MULTISPECIES: MFS transporter [unclassified Dietzia]|uniref:MFS transporter n=1 Tax=unclassified Dietzia TaxID=2617939 RepID=UPI000D228D21|nr:MULTISPECIES: MFS transporter [unclassified Dietzia]AVZ38283.1 MFS transporter [Dietzia sp. JS16-p6b]QGW23287.1 putative drug resistance efflux protein [Dietzia sp. DQ12-45-1b]
MLELTTGRRRWLLFVNIVAVSLVVATMSALYTSLPDIAVATGATQAQLTWIIDSYTLALAALVLTAGALGDRFGRRATLIVGLVLFTAASALPIWLDSPLWVIALRAVAGVGAAFVMPSTLSLLTASFPSERRGTAVGMWAGFAGIGGIVGLLSSGLMLQIWSWKSIFVVYSVVGLLVLLAAFTIGESVASRHGRPDVLGSVFSALAVGGVVFGLIEGAHTSFGEPLVVVALVAAVVSLIGFVLVELRATDPLLDVRYFRRRGFTTGSVAVGMQFLTIFGFFLLMVQYLQLVKGYDALSASLALAPMVIPVMVFSLLSPRITARVGLRVVTVVGLAAIATGMVLLSRLGVDSTYWEILWPLLVASVGLGVSTAPATSAIVSDISVDEQGVAAAVNDAMREVGAAIGIAISGSILAGSYATGIVDVLPGVPESGRQAVESSFAGAVEYVTIAGPALQGIVDAAAEVFATGISDAMFALGMVAAGAAVLLLFVAPGRRYVPHGESESGDAAVSDAADVDGSAGVPDVVDPAGAPARTRLS